MTRPFNKFPDPIQVGRKLLCVFSLESDDDLLLFESYEVADLLGYQQSSSLRKQTLTDWKHLMEVDYDFIMVHDERELRHYDELYALAHRVSVTPTKPSRGRLFFTLQGLVKVLHKTTKNTTELKVKLREKFPFINWNPPMTPKTREFVMGQPCHRCGRPLDANADCPCTPAPKVGKSEPIPGPAFKPTMGTLEHRKFEYHVMQTLIGQLERLKDATLRSLALSAAESALGRRLDEVRTREAIKGVFGTPKKAAPSKVEAAPSQTNPPILVRGPVFTPPHDFYSLTRIGEKAGGYSARQAGLAADIVAEKMGYTREQIRNESLPINQIAMRPDTTTGAKRKMVRFHTNFANRIIQELRSNPRFVPETPASSPTFTPFDTSDSPYPRLSMGPLDEQS